LVSPSPEVIAFTQEPLQGLGLLAALQETPYHVRAVLSDAVQFAETIAAAPPTVVLYDTSHDPSFEQLRRARSATPVPYFVALVAHLTAAQAAPLQDLGIHGVLRRNAPVADIVACLDRVSRGQHWTDSLYEPLFHHPRRSRLTAHETEMVRLVSAGLSNKQIGAALGITEGTVKGNLLKVFRKVGVADRLALAMYGVRCLGLESSPPESRVSNGL